MHVLLTHTTHTYAYLAFIGSGFTQHKKNLWKVDSTGKSMPLCPVPQFSLCVCVHRLTPLFTPFLKYQH